MEENHLVEQPEIPGAGEHAGPDHIQAEASPGPIPEGELTGKDPALDRRRRTLELSPVQDRESADSKDSSYDIIRRTGTDQNALPVVRIRLDLMEQQRDHQAGDIGYENALDPTQDESGPQGDQC
jgi:hypothetical protein